MRDNVSIIFAAIFAVLLLIVFPLFSLLTRQDSIAYNKVLTLTTEFVDSVRNKGYFTEQEYTNYLAGLSSTRNTYKVEMECHKKILIKDVNKYTDENPVWVEDTEIYYNTYIENELRESKVVSLNDGDEFYIKLYNTNITTASLMYNFFLNSRIPRKIINIGYGGKILNTSGNTYAKTTFNSSYTPYITFGEVRNNNDQIFKRCYDREAGTYEMQYCVRVIYVDDEDNNPIKVNFKMHNFDKIADISIGENFLANKDEIIAKIKEKIDLRGDYISSFEVSVDDLKLVNDNIEGTISIRNIGIEQGAWKTSAYIIIGSNLGTGSTGTASTEGTTEELTLTKEDVSSRVKIYGPYLNQNTTEVVSDVLSNMEKVYYKVKLGSSDKIKEIKIRYNRSTISMYAIGTSRSYKGPDYNINVSKQDSNVQEYWIEIIPQKGNLKISNQELQVTVVSEVKVSDDKTRDVTALSKVVVWKMFMLKCKEISYTINSFYSTDGRYVSIKFDTQTQKSIKQYISDMKERGKYQNDADFFKELVDNKIIYTSKEKSDNKYNINIVSANISGDNGDEWKIKYSDILTGEPERNKVYLNFLNFDGSLTSKEMPYFFNMPYTFEFNAGKNNIKPLVMNIPYFPWSYSNYYWIPASVNDIKDSNSYYDDEVTKEMVRNSIIKYGGFYVAEQVGTSATFYKAWKETKNMTGCYELFSSMMYEWQYSKMVEYLGNIQSDYWLAEKSGQDEFKIINNVKKLSTSKSSNSYSSLRVLYLK